MKKNMKRIRKITMDLLKAFDDFRNNIIPQGFNRPLSAEEVDELINEWISR